MKNTWEQHGSDIWIYHTRKRSVGDNLTCPSYISQEDFDVADSIAGTWVITYDGVGKLPYVYNPHSGIYLHRAIMKKIYGEKQIKDYVVDHLDGNRLNNRRSNLRLLTDAQNLSQSRMKIDRPIGRS